MSEYSQLVAGDIYLKAMQFVVGVYIVGGVMGCVAGRWRQGACAILLAVANVLIFW